MGNMKSASSFFCVVMVAAAAAATIFACVGSDPVSTPGGASSSSGASSGGSSGGSSGATCKGDEPTACGADCKQCPVPVNGKATCTGGACGIECDAATTKCGDKCAVLGGDGEHCGACDHSCGGGACLKGTCQAVAVVQGLSATHAFDVGPNILVYSAGNDVASCALPAGCTNAQPKKIAEGYQDMNDVALGDNEVFWISASPINTDSRNVRRCPLDGCVGTPANLGVLDSSVSITNLARSGNILTWHAGNGKIQSYTLPSGPLATVLTTSDTTMVATDGTSIYYNNEDNAAGPVTLAKCPPGALCTVPTTLGTGQLGGPMAIFGGLVYVATPGVTGGVNDGKIYSTNAAAASTPVVVRAEELSPIAVAADADGVYWANTKLEHVRSCPLAGCVGAPRDHALQQTGVKRIRVDAKFVYWMTEDAIYKVAK
jgi:hypothetical protein